MNPVERVMFSKQEPWALFAIRQARCADTQLSLFEYVYGNSICTFLDNLYDGWLDKEKES